MKSTKVENLGREHKLLKKAVREKLVVTFPAGKAFTLPLVPRWGEGSSFWMALNQDFIRDINSRRKNTYGAAFFLELS
jgi:hypothetical protein